MMTQEQLWKLRNEIPLCSLYYPDYRNSFGIDDHPCCDFFDGYADFLEDLMIEDHKEIDFDFFDLLPQYDNEENLWNWYGCFEEDPLPIKEETK